MKRLTSLAVVVYLTACSQARAQMITTGTVVVIDVSKNKVTVAADSRATREGGYRDDDCKIAAFDNKFVFVSALTRHLEVVRPRQITLTWDSHEAARRAFHSVLGSRGDAKAVSIERVATEWANLGVDFFGKGMALGPREFLAKAHIQTTTFSEGLFSGPDQNGEIVAFYVAVFYESPSGATKPVVRASVQKVAPGSFMAMGVTAIFHEFSTLQTERSKRERLRWESEVARQSPEQRTISTVIQLVQWTIAFGPANVGGPVDAVTMDKRGIHWVQRKPQCTER